MLTTPSRLHGPGGSTIEKRCADLEVSGVRAPGRLEDDKAVQRVQPSPPVAGGMLRLGPVRLPLQSILVALLLRLRVLKRETCLFVLQTEKLNSEEANVVAKTNQQVKRKAILDSGLLAGSQGLISQLMAPYLPGPGT